MKRHVWDRWLAGCLLALIWLGTTNLPGQQPLIPLGQDPSEESPEPLELTARVHVQQDSPQGYLVVKVKLQPGYHVYSLTQPPKIPPTQLKCQPNRQFRLTGPFQPDTPPKVIEQDPVFGQRLEKHEKQVQFFAPIELSPGVSPQQLQCEVQFDGMVCSGGSCTPIHQRPIRGKFAGFYRAPGSTQRTSTKHP